ncbi:MAG: class I SAM-dependent methyltransferase [Myxococcales bacterium]|nr:class I SAM-dependent methyltransferase [Myxococcales bacterium]
MLVDRGVVAGNVTDKYRLKNPVARYLMDGFLRTVSEAYLRTGAGEVLEVGCGEGELAAHLRAQRAAEFYGVDISPKVIDIAREVVPEMHLAVQSATDVGFPDRRFDLVMCCEVLEHLPDPRPALRELSRLSRRHVIVSVPREPIWRVLNMARGSYLSDFGNTPGHLQHWSTRAFTRFIASELEVKRVWTPLPWTVIAAEVR